ncbi:MAG TPA: hypothetical protein VN258_00205 [Mobilitalea sp.]|nr:hypothetical protein [Mobilitalea sp.]
MSKLNTEINDKVIPNNNVGAEEEDEIRVSKIGTTLNKFFHFYDRGSSMKQEIGAGVSVFLISICALFMNIQIMSGAISDKIPYSGLYLGATIVSFIGTLLLGFVCNLPLVQVASLSLSSVFISTLGANTGLTYTNLLAITFVSAVVYLLLSSIPGVRKFVFHMLPKSVRNALPVSIGLYVAYTALDKMGIIDGFSLASLSDDTLGGAAIAPYVRLCVFAGIIGFAIMLFLKKRGSKTSALSAFLIATCAFYLIAALCHGIPFSYVFTQNRIWIGVNPDRLGEMYTIGLGLKELQLYRVFTEGFDFSAFTAAGGNTYLIFLQGILTFLFLGMYESEASVKGANLNGKIIEDGSYEKAASKFLLVNAFTNVLAPIVGVAPISIGKQSSVATNDGGRTGLTSIVCAIGYLLVMLTWLPFAVFATYTASVPEYGHAGFVFPNVILASFQIADAVMLVVGLMMLKGFQDFDGSDFTEAISFILTILGGFFTKNIAYGVAFGVMAYTFLKLISFKKDEIKSITIPTTVLTILSIILIIMVF